VGQISIAISCQSYFFAATNMRLRDENKRKTIVQVAGKLFADRPFHQVRLEEVAQAAGIGKGTVYIYFKSKEELYYSLLYDGFADLVEQLEQRLAQAELTFSDKIRVIVHGLIDFSIRHPQLAEVMRNTAVPDADSQWGSKRRELTSLIERVIRQGVDAASLVDPRPDLTALYFLGMVRAVLVYTPNHRDGDALAKHLSGIILNGIALPKAD
jgi:AcrR family transcriptional regulator